MNELTNKQINRMTAEKVMEWHDGIAFYHDKTDNQTWQEVDKWHPSTDLNQAWQVAEKMEDWWWVMVETYCDRVRVIFTAKDNENKVYKSWDDSPSRAICLAALQVVEGK